MKSSLNTVANRVCGFAKSLLDTSFKIAATAAATMFIAKEAPEDSSIKLGASSLVSGAESVASAIVKSARSSAKTATARDGLNIYE